MGGEKYEIIVNSLCLIISNIFGYKHFFVCYLATEGSERDYLPHQEAKIKAGLEKAVQHKDKLLEFDRNRFVCPDSIWI